MKIPLKALRLLFLLPFLGLVMTGPAISAETRLEKEMSKINKGYKLLGKQARSGKYDYDGLAKAFSDAASASKAAARLVPEKIEGMKSASEKKKALAAYQKEIGQLTSQLSQIVAICKSKDAGKLKAAADSLKKMKKSGHDKFIED